MSISNIHNLRATTIVAKDAIQLSVPSQNNRRLLDPAATASLYSNDHDCATVNKEHTYIKVTSRFLFSMFRFYVSYGLMCTTRRGSTWANGAQSHCSNRCQAAHAALSPTLLDDTFQVSCNHLIAQPYKELSPIKKEVIKRCLRLSQIDIENLNNLSQEKREGFLESHQHPSFYKARSGAFVCTSIGEMRNATFEGPTAGTSLKSHGKAMTLS